MNQTLYDTTQIRAIEQYAMTKMDRSAQDLMEAAGLALWRFFQRRWPNAHSLVLCCGGGNNAGDAYVMARLAKEQGMSVRVLYLVPPESLLDAARDSAMKAIAAGVDCKVWDSFKDLNTADCIVDGVLGIGLNRVISDKVYLACIAAINQAKAPVLSVDVPSGVCAQTGQVLGAAVNADATVTFIGEKQGLYTGSAVGLCGEVYCDHLEIDPTAFALADFKREKIVDSELLLHLPKRLQDTHKGNYGHVLVVGGDKGMVGAVSMAAQAALRSGAGLVSVAFRACPDALSCYIPPEIIRHAITESEEVDALLEQATVVVVGPGLSSNAWSQKVLDSIMLSKLPKIIDAGALRLLGESTLNLNDCILTPHPGEAAQLLRSRVADVQVDRFAAITAIQEHTQATVVLKGAGSLIASNGEPIAVCAAGNPGMATAGMGDILSGVIAGLCAQGVPHYYAARLGVYVHAKAGDQVAKALGERGMVASDLLPFIHQIVNPNQWLE